MLYYMETYLTFVLSARAEIAYSTPIDAIVIISEVFPELIRGNGKPVGGILPLTTSALMTV